VLILPEDFIAQKFFQFAGAARKNKFTDTYQGSCPMCREGNSWLVKKRFYYIPKDNRLYCHNCGYNSNPVKWVMDITGCSFWELKEELNNSSVLFLSGAEEKPKYQAETLPKDSINLFDKSQIDFYRNNSVVQKTLEFIEHRKIVNAINRTKALYISLTDKVHKNRLILPFYDENGKIVYYQTRTILESDEDKRPRYISKIGGDKTLFNIDKVDLNYDTIFIFEGPINSCFVKNGVAVGGIQENSYQLFSVKQQEQINKFPFHKRIWVLDSQHKDSAALNKTKKLLKVRETVFLWPEKIGKIYKDFNDISMAIDINVISPEFIIKNAVSVK